MLLMMRRFTSQPTEPVSIDDPRDRILAAAERFIERHGMRNTTIEDVAAEVGMSRPGIYRYFANRDDLLVELISRHARALLDRAHKFICGQATLQDQIVEGLSTWPTRLAGTRSRDT